MKDQPPVVWKKTVPDSEIQKFKSLIEQKYNLHFDDYWDLHKWSVHNFVDYWEEMWKWFNIVSSKPYEQVYSKTGPGFMDNEWFKGALFNLAENVLIHRDDTEAILYADDDGNIDHVTYAEMYEEVKLYAAALRKSGLEKGDVVCVQMSNRKEAIYVMLATTSIGAVFSGPQAYLGVKMSARMIGRVEPKFLFIVDRHRDEELEIDFLRTLPYIVANVPSLKKVIIIPTQDKSTSKDISHISKSCFLPDFLQEGLLPDGSVPDMVFEQVPFHHPAFIAFTSGSTNLPKAPIHCTGAFISLLADYSFLFDFKKGDTWFNIYAPGWILWIFHVLCLRQGVRVFLYAGGPFSPENNLWDVLDRHHVTTCMLVPALIEHMLKTKLVPSSYPSCEHLKSVWIGGCPLNNNHINFIQNNVNKNILVGNIYGCTETLGVFTAFDYNQPAYLGEIQAIKLGCDLRVVDDKGRPVMSEKGDVIVATPMPGFAQSLFKDCDGSIMQGYFQRHPGAWCSNDVAIINPITRGMCVIGRRDNVCVTGGERFYPDDIYIAIGKMEELEDYICVVQTRKTDWAIRTVLFVKLAKGHTFSPEMRMKIAQVVQDELYWELVPEIILPIQDIPYTANKKRMESVVRVIVDTNEIPTSSSIKNPECLQYFRNIPEITSFNSVDS